MLAKIARSLTSPLLLLPARRHEHAWNFTHTDPPGTCVICGCGYRDPWRDRFRDWRDAMHDVFDTGER